MLLVSTRTDEKVFAIYTRMQRAAWSGVAGRRSGTARVQAGMRWEQRGSKEQPGGSAVSCGTVPGMGRSLPRSSVGEAARRP